MDPNGEEEVKPIIVRDDRKESEKKQKSKLGQSSMVVVKSRNQIINYSALANLNQNSFHKEIEEEQEDMS